MVTVDSFSLPCKYKYLKIIYLKWVLLLSTYKMGEDQNMVQYTMHYQNLIQHSQASVTDNSVAAALP